MSEEMEDYALSEDELDERERREMQILNIHPFLPGRPVICKGSTNTSRKGWRSSAHHGREGKRGIVLEVHSNVLEAIKIKFGNDDNDPHFWHYKDFMLEEIEEEHVAPVFFNPLNLVV